MSISLPTYVQVLVDLAESLVASGFRHIFFLNGHGGNADPMRMAVRMLRDRHPDLVAAAACYWDLASAEINRLRRSGQGGMSHACELETSLMLQVRPETVKRERIAPSRPRWRIPWLVQDLAGGGSGVTLGYHIDDVAPSGVMGDPELASPEAGAVFLDAISARVAEFLVDFSSWRMEALTGHD
jgi:creatinine amidohydrolase